MNVPRVVTKRNKNKKNVYYFYSVHNSFKEALNEGKLHKKKDKSKFYILETEVGYWFPKKVSILYLNNKLSMV